MPACKDIPEMIAGDDYVIDDNTYREKKSGFFQSSYPEISSPLAYDAEGAEIFVVSDLHIASGRNAVGVFGGTENFFADDPFARFLAYAHGIKKTGQALLVFNGDIFDFLRVVDYPGRTRTISMTRKIKFFFKGYKPAPPQKPSPEHIEDEFDKWSAELQEVGIGLSPDQLRHSIKEKEKKYGLETNDYKTIYKLIRIKEGHPVFFAALANWLICGNRILILKGNHDLELCWPKVREFVRLMLAKSIATRSAETLANILANVVRPNIRFADDSVLIDGDFYLEHGHRYDKFAMVLGCPVLDSDHSQINIPFGSFFNRYLINRVELYYPYLDKVRPSGNIIPMLIRDNFPLALKIIFQQIPFTLKILSTNRRYVWFMLRRVIPLLLLVLIPVIVLIVTNWSWFIRLFCKQPTTDSSAFTTGLLKTAEAIGSMVLSYFLTKAVAWFQLTEPDSLFKFAKRRHQLPPGPYRIMTMGHTHNPGEYFLDERETTPEKKGRFYNTGTWIPVIETSDASVREDHTHTFLHLERDSKGDLQPAAGGLLQRWNDDAGRADPQLLIQSK